MMEVCGELRIRLHYLLNRVEIIKVSSESVEFQSATGDGFTNTFGRKHFIAIYYKDYDEDR